MAMNDGLRVVRFRRINGKLAYQERNAWTGRWAGPWRWVPSVPRDKRHDDISRP
jgi:hypothetical protein